MTKQEEIIDAYKAKCIDAQREIAEYTRLSNRYSMIRLVIFIAAIPLLYFVIKTNVYIAIVFFITIGAIFVWAVLKQQRYEKLQKEHESLLAINQNEINCITNHHNLYDDGVIHEVPNHHYTNDLDIFGPHSIYALINRCRTYYGTRHLRDAFLHKPTKASVLEKQEAIQELSQALQWRQELAVKLYPLSDENHNIAEIIDRQLNMDLSFASGPLLSIYRKALPVIWLVVIGLYFYNSGIANTIASVLFLGNLAITGKYTQQISEVQGRLSAASNSLKKYIDVLHTIFTKQWSSKLLSERSAAFEKTTSDMPLDSLARLSSLINQLDYRLNLLVAIGLNGLILWDLVVISRLYSWKTKNENKIDQIFDHIGFMESMSALAAWSYNHPQYVYPTITAEFMRLDTQAVEHPLIPTSQNVANDFTLEPTHEVVIITGSNMSGKSTLLRTLGINMILGYTGAKVAAASLSMPIVTIVTYMRIKDALEENVSTFKAELNRISMILEVIDSTPDAFILIDEMLRGTNSKDKLNGSIGITKRLLDSGAYAMIATHDIKLAELGEDENRIANYYFDIDYKDGDLVFDYKVKVGICQNFNASFLLRQLGIETEVS